MGCLVVLVQLLLVVIGIFTFFTILGPVFCLIGIIIIQLLYQNHINTRNLLKTQEKGRPLKWYEKYY